MVSLICLYSLLYECVRSQYQEHMYRYQDAAGNALLWKPWRSIMSCLLFSVFMSIPINYIIF